MPPSESACILEGRSRTASISSRNAFVRELDAPELAGGIKHLEAEFEDAGIFGVRDANDAKFLGFLGNSVEQFDARAEARLQRSANQRATAADGDGFGESDERLTVHTIAEELHRDANKNARRAAALYHRAGGSHVFVSCSPRAQRFNVVRSSGRVKGSAGWCAALTNRRARVNMGEPRSFVLPHTSKARVAELADALASGASSRKGVEVRVLSRAPYKSRRFPFWSWCFCSSPVLLVLV